MKFTDGHWQMRDGMVPHYASEVYEVAIEGEELVVHAATRPLAGRGSLLNQSMITVRYSSPAENVVRVRMYHHWGGRPRPGSYDLLPQSVGRVSVEDGEQAAVLTTGRLSVQVRKGPDWQVEFRDGERVIASSGRRAAGFVDTPEGRFIHEQLSLAVGECVYGLGERFTPLVKNGQVVDLWNADGGTSSEQAYKNVPFYMTNRGYGVFINHPERVSFEVASENVERVQFSVPGEALEYFFIYGPSAREVLERYTALTGRPALPPPWSFGLWLSTSFTTNYSEATVTEFVQGMAERDLPMSVFHFDCFWMREGHWIDLTWDERAFPDPEGMLRRLKDRGLRICVWINPYIAQQSRLFNEGLAGGYLLTRPNGDVWQTDDWQPGMALVDFTNPEACRWYRARLRALLSMGVDCFKTDFGERIPTDVRYFDGSDPLKMHNLYSYLYNRTVFEELEEHSGRGQAIVFARSATAGSQRFPVHWGGDSRASYESMAETLRGGLSLSLSGFGFWSHDMGGFEDTATPDLYKRWCAFGLLSSHSRLHGSSSYRVPWLFDEEAVHVLRHFTRLKCRLMPYLYAAAVEAHQTGIPVMRPMMLEFGDDPACDYLDRQYLLGSALLVAPVFSPDGLVEYYLPAGSWTNFLTGTVVEGGRWVRERHDYFSLPLMVRENTILPVGANDQRPDYDYAAGVTFHVFQPQPGASFSAWLPASDGRTGITANASPAGDHIRFQTENLPDGWSILLRGSDLPRSVEGGSAAEDPLGTRCIPNSGADDLTVWF